MEFNQINDKKSCNKYFEKDLQTIIDNFIKAATITCLPLVLKAMIDFMNGGTIEHATKIFFSDRDMFIILVSVVSSATFVTYKYLNRKPLSFVCWVCVGLSFGLYLKTEHINTFRGIMWFLISIIFSFLNILASQYIPKDRRKKEC